MDKASKKQIRYAVVGLGKISQGSILPAFAKTKKNSVLTALVSGEKAKAQKLAKEFSPAGRSVAVYDYEEYEAMLKGGTVDAVYIALPNDMHYEYSSLAIKNGVHVLCEKPLTVASPQAQALDKQAKAAKVHFMTAYRLHFEKTNLKAIKIAQSGKIGEVRYFLAGFSMQVDKGDVRTQKAKGGGAVYDIGIYCINAIRYIFREVPSEIFAYSSRAGSAQTDPRFKEIDEMTTVSMRFSSGKLATFTCSFGAAPTDWYEVVGTKGSMRLDNCFDYRGDGEFRLTKVSKNHPEGKLKKQTVKKQDQFAPELRYFSDCILSGRSPEPGVVEGWIDIKIIEAILQSARTGKPVHLPVQLNEKIRHEFPTLAQKNGKLPRKKAVLKTPASSARH